MPKQLAPDTHIEILVRFDNPCSLSTTPATQMLKENPYICRDITICAKINDHTIALQLYGILINEKTAMDKYPSIEDAICNENKNILIPIQHVIHSVEYTYPKETTEHPTILYIHQIYVKPSYRNNALATIVLRNLSDIVRAETGLDLRYACSYIVPFNNEPSDMKDIMCHVFESAGFLLDSFIGENNTPFYIRAY